MAIEAGTASGSPQRRVGAGTKIGMHTILVY